MAKLNSQEKLFLNQLLTPVTKKLQLSWLMTVISTVLFVFQAWALASIFSVWLHHYFANQTPHIDVLWRYLPWLAVCVFARPALQTLRELISANASLTVKTMLKERLLSALASLGPARTQFGSDGSLSTQVIEQTDALDGFISRFAVQKKVVASTPLILLIAVASQSLMVAGILLLTAPLVPVFMILIGRMTASKSAEQFDALSQLSGRFLDWVRGMPTLKRLQATPFAQVDLSHASEDYRHRTMDVLKIAFLNGAVLELLSALCIALVAVYLGFGLMGVLPWAKGHVPVDYFASLFILLLVPEFYAPLRQLGSDYHAKAQAEGAVQSLLPMLHQADMLHQAKKLQASPPLSVQINPSSSPFCHHPNQAPSLTLTEVGIISQTDDTVRTRLTPISLHIAPQERIALMGQSGSGKSSLLQALMGFSDYQGQIQIGWSDANKNDNDHDAHNDKHSSTHNNTHNNNSPINITHELSQLSAEELATWRDNLSHLAQTVALLPMSIADNLRLAKPDATDNELMTALEQVQLWDLVKQLPEGIHTLLGERGSGLSGGQAQRLGLAQLLLQDAPLWLLDEPTEHLDSDTKDAIHQLLGKISHGKTVIWVTHDAKQLPWLDRVIHMDKTHMDKMS